MSSSQRNKNEENYKNFDEWNLQANLGKNFPAKYI